VFNGIFKFGKSYKQGWTHIDPGISSLQTGNVQEACFQEENKPG
jgi:hypothetical protein